MKQDQAKRFIASRLEAFLQVFGFAQWRIAQSQENVVLADSRPRRHPLRSDRCCDQALPLGQFEVLAYGIIDSRDAHSRALIAHSTIAEHAPQHLVTRLGSPGGVVRHHGVIKNRCIWLSLVVRFRCLASSDCGESQEHVETPTCRSWHNRNPPKTSEILSSGIHNDTWPT